MYTVSITESRMLAALRSFLLVILPAGTEVVRGQDNRVAEPKVSDFVVMTPILRERLSTNIDAQADVLFTGSIAGPTMTVTDVAYGHLAVGNQVFGQGIAANTTITAILTGTGGIGSYTVTPSQMVASEVLAAGLKSAMQPTKVTMQLDVHGPSSADNSQAISTLLRDEFAVAQFATSGYDVTPLYAGEPRQVPFVNGEQQVEFRWIVEAVLQANPVISVPQQYAGILAIDLIDVDVVYPPS